jgi:hypothetical protein
MIADEHQKFFTAPANALPCISQLLPDDGWQSPSAPHRRHHDRTGH